MNWSAKLFLSVLLFAIGIFSFFAGLLFREELPVRLKYLIIGVPTLFLLGFILGLLSVWRDEQHKTLAKGITFVHGLALLAIGYLYYDFAMNFSLDLNIRIFG